MKSRNPIAFFFVLALLIVLTLMQACFPEVNIVIENQTNEHVNVYLKELIGSPDQFTVDKVRWYDPVGKLDPNEQVSVEVGFDFGQYAVKAEDNNGEVIFFDIYTFSDNLQKTGRKIWKAIIPSN